MEENISVEMQEVAEPAVEEIPSETGAEVQEVAEPESEGTGKTDADSAFAAMRRENEALKKQLEEQNSAYADLQAEHEARSSMFEDADLDEIELIAEATGASVEDVEARIEAQRELSEKDRRIEHLEKEKQELMGEFAKQQYLREVQAIDPTVKSLEELGDTFMECMQAKKADGSYAMSVETAYKVAKADEIMNKVTPPREIGKVKDEPPEKAYFTEAEVDAMTPEEQRANADKIKKSFQYW